MNDLKRQIEEAVKKERIDLICAGRSGLCPAAGHHKERERKPQRDRINSVVFHRRPLPFSFIQAG